MRAALLAVGSELLGADRLDTNALLLTAHLERFGVTVERKVIVGDDEAALVAEIARLIAEVDLLLVGGGLGPTADDVTREAVAAACGRSLVRQAEIEQQIAARFASFGMRMPETNRKQADVITGAEVLVNRWGSAPGQRLEVVREGRSCTLFLFPGVPRELERMAEAYLLPWLAERSGGRERETWTLKVACLPESTVDEWVRPAYQEFGREQITILAALGETRLRFSAVGTYVERRAALAPIAARLRELVGRAVFAEGDKTTLEQVVGELLLAEGSTLATAESCTGGLVAERITRVAGSSAYFVGGIVAYSNQLKQQLLGVGEEPLVRAGAVSREVAEAMAEGVRQRLGATWGVGITGIAGPAGGSDEKPVGTVHVALAGPAPAAWTPGTVAEDDEHELHTTGYGGPFHRVRRPDGLLVEHRRLRFPGDRERVRQLASQFALELLRRRLLARAGDLAAMEERW
jgi:nicotinamide-nucleotide amidase